MAVVERNGKQAITRYSLISSGIVDGAEISLLHVKILTGRTHQIRVHLASIGHPVLGDALYGGSRTAVSGADRQLLHAWKLELPHPATGEMIRFQAPVPEDMQFIISKMIP
jgi:23S rRNA pseudouridine1911/1915/1917 synthase